MTNQTAQDYNLSLFDYEAEELFELQAFGSSGGKSRVAVQLVSMIPPHKTYVECFAGGAAVFWKKEKVEKNVLNDKNSEIAFAYQFIRDHTPEQLNQLKQMNWVPEQGTWKKLRDSDPPQDPVQRFYRFFYVQAYSYGLSSKSYGHKKNQTKVYNRFEKLKEELKGTEVYSTNANEVISKNNSEETFIYLDPPYPEEWAGPEGTKLFSKEDTQELHDALKEFKGKWLMSINDLPWIRTMFSDFTVKNFTVPRSFRKGDKPKDELLIYNYDIKSLSESVKDLAEGVTDSGASEGDPIDQKGLQPTKFIGDKKIELFLVKRKDKWCVTRKDGSVIKCFPTKAKAEAMFKAIIISEKKRGKLSNNINLINDFVSFNNFKEDTSSEDIEIKMRMSKNLSDYLERAINIKMEKLLEEGILDLTKKYDLSLTLNSERSNMSYEEETEKINENKKKPEAFKKHNFKPAEWTHKNGHPRCLICGDEESTRGFCEGIDGDSNSKSGKVDLFEPFECHELSESEYYDIDKFMDDLKDD